ADGVDVIDVTASGTRLRDVHALRIERRCVPLGNLTPPLRPLFEVPQLHAEDGALNAVHPVVESLVAVLVALLFPPVAQRAAHRRQIRARRCHRTAFAVGAEILAGIEAEARDLRDRSAAAAMILRAVRLR